MDELKLYLYKMIVGVSALVLCVLFFAMPIVSYDRFTATGWNLVFDSYHFKGFPIIIIVLLAPIILTILAFVKKSFKILQLFSKICLITYIVYLVSAYAEYSL